MKRTPQVEALPGMTPLGIKPVTPYSEPFCAHIMIDKLFKFSRRPVLDSFDVIHRDSDHTVMDVQYMYGREGGMHWQAHRNGKTFDASTRAAAVRGLVLLLGLSFPVNTDK